jgi:hypothetical protein
MFRIYLMVGGMPEAVATWVETKDFPLVIRDKHLVCYVIG